jgi:hypothetical protein
LMVHPIRRVRDELKNIVFILGCHSFAHSQWMCDFE